MILSLHLFGKFDLSTGTDFYMFSSKLCFLFQMPFSTLIILISSLSVRGSTIYHILRSDGRIILMQYTPNNIILYWKRTIQLAYVRKFFCKLNALKCNEIWGYTFSISTRCYTWYDKWLKLVYSMYSWIEWAQVIVRKIREQAFEIWVDAYFSIFVRIVNKKDWRENKKVAFAFLYSNIVLVLILNFRFLQHRLE